MHIDRKHREPPTPVDASTEARPSWIDAVGLLPAAPPRIAAPRAADAARTAAHPEAHAA